MLIRIGLIRTGLPGLLLLIVASTANGGGTPPSAADNGLMVTGTLSYRERIDERMTYSVFASIRSGDRLSMRKCLSH
jgi:hypothetical protein